MVNSVSTHRGYDERFFSYTSSLSRRSAQAMVPVLREVLPNVASVVDFGCAQGVWLRCWMDAGIDDIQGVDGDYVDRSALLIPVEHFRAQDLNETINLGRRFDLAYSLEVAEHLHPESSERFVESLTHHADMVLFSAAPPGQGGEHHINEQSYDYWRALFAHHGYWAYDAVRPRIATIAEISFWYRYNTILYVKDGAEAFLSEDVQSTRIPNNQSIVDNAPVLFKLRKAVVRMLPAAVQNALARLKACRGV